MIDRQDAFYMVQLWQKFLLDSSAKGMATIPLANDFNILTDILASKWLPLHFFFCDSYGLPLVALQYNEVEIRINYAGSANTSNYKYYANYVVLDTDERAMFVNKDHEILIEQLQRVTSSQQITSLSQDVSFDLNLLNHPVKCLMWGSPLSNGSNTLTTSNVQIYLNGTEMFGSLMPDPLFTQVQAYYHSEFATELLKGDSTEANTGGKLKMYSFAVKANRHYPTGSCNFSRLDNAKLTMTFGADQPFNPFYVHAVNFNILRIKKGMAGLAFAN